MTDASSSDDVQAETDVDVESVSATSHCQNCGARLAGPWCHVCGQKTMPALRLWLVMLSDSMSEFFALDGKLSRTFISLLIRPGELSQSYLQGRRVHYINPIRLYIVLSLLYFLTLSIQNAFVEQEVSKPEPEERAWLNYIKLPVLSDAQNVAVIDYINQQVDEATQNPGDLMDQVYEISPLLIVLLLPLNAMFAKVLFWTARRYFVEHLIVSLHAMSFFYLASLFQQLVDLLPSFLEFLKALTGPWIGIYLYLLLRRVYGGRHRTLIPRYLLLLFLNGIFTTLLFGTAYALGVLTL
ncbi:MAG: DUF3667 domain-containing protein [Pseudomonadota bacterium]